MSTTLTLGPVTLALPLSVNVDGDIVLDATGEDVAHVDPFAKHATEWAHPLATLFAASPALLVAAEALVASSSGMHRGICNANHVGPLGGGGCSCPMGREFRALRTAIARARGAA